MPKKLSRDAIFKLRSRCGYHNDINTTNRGEEIRAWL